MRNLILAIILIAHQVTFAQTYKIVDTGVTTHYSTDAIISATSSGDAFHGQDASYKGNQPSYTNNGDGTITDNITGLMWEEDMGEKISYTDALTKAKNSTLGGHTDWRVPTIKELYSLANFTGRCFGDDVIDKFIDTDYFKQPIGDESIGERQIDAQTWSSTVYTSTTMGGDTTIFGYNFVDGRLKGYPKYDKRTGVARTMYFRLVRGNTAYGVNNFVDNGDGTITDKATGLMWQQADDGTTRNWENALSYAEDLTLAGHNDWRLPNAKELHSIVDYSRSPDATNSPAIDPLFSCTSFNNPEGNSTYGYYWTGSPLMDGTQPYSDAVYICFGEAQGQMTFPPTNTPAIYDTHGAGASRNDPKEKASGTTYPTYWGPQGDIIYVNNYVRAVRTATVSIQGSIQPSNSGSIKGIGTYNFGATVELMATPETGYNFVNWTENGTEVSKEATYSFAATDNRTLVANFEEEKKPTFQISATVTPTNSGTISGTGTYNSGETVKLMATSKAGFDFVNWTEDGTEISTDSTYSFTVDKNRTLVANFKEKPAPTFEISATANPNNGGTINGTGTYNLGETIKLMATSKAGFDFVNWTEDGTEISTDSTYSFTVDKNRTLVANFKEKPTPTFEISATANPNNGGIINGTGTYELGKIITLIATPESGFNFVNWTENGAEVSTDSTYSFTVDKNRTLEANFATPTGITVLDIDNSFEVYPNPTRELINIKLSDFSIKQSSDIQLFLIDNTGRISELELINFGSNQIQTKIRNQPSGIYYLRLMVDEKPLKTFKIMVNE